MCNWVSEDIKEEDKVSAKARANDLKKLEQTKEEKLISSRI
jgi:hypothetical protein